MSFGLLFFVFVLAIFLGVELISKVPSQLHTPLMSGTNAISGITIVGALTAAGSVIHQDVPEEALGVGRARQRNVEGWARRKGPQVRKRAKKAAEKAAGTPDKGD